MEHIIQRVHLHFHYGRYQHLDRTWNSSRFSPLDLYIQESRLYLPESGSGIMEHNGRQYELKRGNMVLVPSFTNANFYCSDHLTKYWCHFNAFMENTQNDLFSLLPEIAVIQLTEEEFDYYSAIFRQMVRIGQEKQDPQYYLDPVDMGKLRSSLYLLIAPFLRCLPEDLPQSCELDRIMQLLRYMYANLDKPLTLEQLARICQLHPSYMSELFRRCTGCSPIHCLHLIKFQRAILELRQDKLRISEVAEMLGFENPSLFSRFFHKKAQMSPRQFRLLARKERTEKNSFSGM